MKKDVTSKTHTGKVKTNPTDESGRFDFVGKAWFFGLISAILVALSLIFLAVRGITYGIDFSGGTEVQVRFKKPLHIDQFRAFLEKENLVNLHLQSIGDDNEFIVRFQNHKVNAAGDAIQTEKEINETQNATVNHLRDDINKDLAANEPEIRRVDSVGPQVGAELKKNGFLSVFYCLLVILIYVCLRFDYAYAPGAVLCLAHDAAITLGIFVLVGKEVNIPIMAAILTLIGYSLNDTIVVFDRIRETEHIYKDRGYRFIINRAINDMLERTVITSGTVFVSALSLYFFAGGTVSDIAFAICIGIIFGTYSSIYVAAPCILLIEKLQNKSAPVTRRTA